MQRLFTQEQFLNSKPKDLLPYKCEYCENTYYLKKKHTYTAEKRNSSCCSILCGSRLRDVGKFIVKPCKFCEKPVKRSNSELNKPKRKSKDAFCNLSCHMKYQIRNGKRKPRSISKLELWIKNELLKTYPNLNILFNNKLKIKLELDIYIPSLNLAFEINGRYHYEPIYGEEKLKNRQKFDRIKQWKCERNNIILFVIDTREQKYFNEGDEFCFKYINFIKEKIDFYNNLVLLDTSCQLINGLENKE